MFIIGLTGLSCSGKTTLSINLQKKLGEDKCLLISMDDYYKELTEEQYKILYKDEAEINFDVPDAIDFEKMKYHIDLIRANKPCKIPKFDTGSCVVTNYLTIEPNKYKYLIVEGVFIFSNQVLEEIFNLKIWVETSEYVCALRRFMKYTRDVKGYSPEFVYNQCVKYVIPGQEKYIKPVKSTCDVIYNGENSEEIYVEMVAYLIRQKSLLSVASNYEN